MDDLRSVPGAGEESRLPTAPLPAGGAFAPARIALYFGSRYTAPLLAMVALAARPGAPEDRDLLPAVLAAQVVCAFACHALAWRRPEALRAAVWGGLVADVLAVSAMVNLTGGPGGPLTFLFTVQALAAGILLSASLGIRVLILSMLAILALGFLGSAGPGSAGGLEPVLRLWVIGGAGTLFSAFNERELTRRNAELSMVRQIALDIQNTLSLGVVLEHLARGVTEGLHFDGAAALIREDDVLKCIAASGVTGAVSRGLEIRGPLARALATGLPVVVTREEARRDGCLVEVLGARGYVALSIGGHGLLVATRAGRKGRPGRLHAHEIESLARLTHHAAVAVANARLHEHVSTLAVTDPLTGLANHGELQRRLAAEAGRLQRYAPLRAPGHRLALLLIDIDHFKRFNDRFGHPAGDEVLRAVAATLQGAVRSFDVVARYGGEEFAAILPETGTEGAVAVAERIRAAVAAAPFAGASTRPVAITVSVGVAASPENGRSAADLIAAADAALYRSKEAGRNRVTLAERGEGTRLGSIVEIGAKRRPKGPDGGPAPAGSRRARGRSSLPRSRTPRG
ncbi:MAG: GGDEF domain-containing protein [Acidobacteria bacterium]|nr:GGDEF domain-containing protein [Acidobacteriota bacterium]